MQPAVPHRPEVHVLGLLLSDYHFMKRSMAIEETGRAMGGEGLEIVGMVIGHRHDSISLSVSDNILAAESDFDSSSHYR